MAQSTLASYDARVLWPSMGEHTLAAPRLQAMADHPWDILIELSDLIPTLGAGLSPDDFDHPTPNLWIAKDARLAANITLLGPCIIGRGTELRPGAYIRGGVLVGDGAVVGNSTELKNCILFDGVQVPHFNYVGDSILGYRAHLGAGAITANVRLDKRAVRLATEPPLPTGRRKLGALVGDGAEVGCHGVLCPGVVLAAGEIVLPGEVWRGKFSHRG